MADLLPTSSLDVPRFVGVANFMRLPTPKTLDGLDVGIIGLPCDSGAPFRTGARFGPGAIRAISVMLRPVMQMPFTSPASMTGVTEKLIQEVLPFPIS